MDLSKSHNCFHLLKYSLNKSLLVFLSKLFTIDFTNKFFAKFCLEFNSSKSFLYLSKLSLNVLFFHLWKYLLSKSLSKFALFFSYILYINFDFNNFIFFLLTASFHLLKAFLNESLSFFSLRLYNLLNLLLNLSGFLYLSNLSKNSSPKFLIKVFFIILTKSSISFAFFKESKDSRLGSSLGIALFLQIFNFFDKILFLKLLELISINLANNLYRASFDAFLKALFLQISKYFFNKSLSDKFFFFIKFLKIFFKLSESIFSPKAFKGSLCVILLTAF